MWPILIGTQTNEEKKLQNVKDFKDLAASDSFGVPTAVNVQFCMESHLETPLPV